MQLSEGVSRWFTPLACGPGSPELSKSYMDMASKIIIYIYIYIYTVIATAYVSMRLSS